MSNDVTVRESGEVMSREKIELIKQTVAKGASDLELDLFLHACKRTGLDPLMKQIYAIKRWNSQEKKETMAIQTGIDGYRLIADRTGRYAGSDEPVYEVGPDGFPSIASVTIYKMIEGQRCAFGSSARWTEYVQTTREGQPTAMWKKMPFLMLGKCAEALALRKAFPAELSGVYTHEEMMQADNEPRHAIADHKQTAQAKINELRSEGAASGSSRPDPATPVPATGTLTPLADAAWKRWLLYVEADDERGTVLADFKEREDITTLSVIKPVNRARFINEFCAYAAERGVTVDTNEATV